MPYTSKDILNHYNVVRRLRGQEAADRYLEAVEAIGRISDRPSAALVESAMHMANTECARVINNH